MDLNAFFEKGIATFGLKKPKVEKAEDTIQSKTVICSGCKAIIVDERCPYCRKINPLFHQQNTQRLEDRENRLEKLEKDLEKEIQELNATLYLVYFGVGFIALFIFVFIDMILAEFGIRFGVSNIIAIILTIPMIIPAIKLRKKPREKKLRAEEKLTRIKEERRNLFLK